MTEISSDDDDDGWHDNYDGDADNIDEILNKYWLILGISTWWKEG